MSNIGRILSEKFPNSQVLNDHPLADFTHTKTGGPADAIIFPKSVAELQAILAFSQAQQLPLTVLGNASNLIVKDGGIEGLVIFLTELTEITCQNNVISAQAGATIIHTSEFAQAHGLSGLEFASGIPGSVGGAVFMNAGAYGGESKDVIESVLAVSRDGQLKEYQKADLNFGYRHSIFQENQEIVVQANFRLTPNDKQIIQAKMDDLNYQRASKQPLEYPSCGSVFKRPVGHFTGKLVHDAGLQGYQVGGAQVSKKHAGFIVNVDHAKGSDYQKVITHVQDVVKEKFNVQLETEVRIIGRD